ncbi:MAG: hypothetical protein H0W08_04605, partial [Acidobacteria bacterium]|nr:hypothetical protein [Acidobacteriota bacterium]
SLVGIANGTSNFVLTQCDLEGTEPVDALGTAQRRGYAEPDPQNDIDGTDAGEKLAVLLQHFAARHVPPDGIETRGIAGITSTQIRHARELGGVLKPIVCADWTKGLEAFVGPAFLPAAHPLSRVDGVENALLLGRAGGRLLFQGPGAGPDVTAATVLDDVLEVAAGAAPLARADLKSDRPGSPETGWFVTVDAVRLPRPVDVADLLGSYGIYAHRTSARHAAGGREHQSLLAWPVRRPQLEAALDALRQSCACATAALRALEPTQ